MKRFCLFISVLALAVSSWAGPLKCYRSAIAVIPQPQKMVTGDKVFCLKPSSGICLLSDDADLKFSVDLLGRHLSPVFGRPLEQKEKAAVRIVLSPAMKRDAYSLKVGSKGVDIVAGSASGAFYACQTLLQLMPVAMPSDGSATGIEIPYVDIEDAPVYQLRSMMLDCSRHFFTVDEIKDLLDLLAMHKMNSFHWHLTDSQGWRVEIKKYPELTRIGNYRPYTVRWPSWKPNDIPVDGYYTQEQVRDIIRYAAERFISIIPEIDIPGHSNAALASYQWLGCRGEGYKVLPNFMISKEVFCPGKETTFEFLENVLAEIIELFPSEYIHIGGDECPKDEWMKCPHCQKRIADEGLQDEKALQSYTIRRVEKFIRSKGRKLVGWDEISEGGLSTTAVVMQRYFGDRARKVFANGNYSILCPNFYCYFDYYQVPEAEHANEPYCHIGSNKNLNVECAYSLDPARDYTPMEMKQVLGLECNLWTEHVPDFNMLQYKLLPRLDAFSEAAWTASPDRSYEEFLKRLSVMVSRYDAMGLTNYAKHAFTDKE
ncbi:MAG: beta-N-acetylhexosaminidase [Clostridium sp.]|nr:beta-N-acetylhexosaminidase [Bacteroides sp.]MCM1197451.1 beta-N-acetylhexosaminidase [Clostridium sp.]